MQNMKTHKYLFIAIFAIFLWGCNEDTMDDINKDVNTASAVNAFALLPDATLKTVVTASATDLAWYASKWIEHSAGQWAQSHDNDRRIGMNTTSSYNNHWNGMYYIQLILKNIIELCSPGGPEENNKHALGIAQVLTAYNLAMITNFWGEAPWSEALQGAQFMKPKYDKQSILYSDAGIFGYLTDGIANLEAAKEQGSDGPNAGIFDYIYAGNNDKWIMAAYSLKARYHMQLTQKDNDASSKALAALANGFASAADALIFNKYEASTGRDNPWFQFMGERSHLAASSTIFDLMDSRSDPRIVQYFSTVSGAYNPAPPGEAERVQGGVYSESLITANGRTAATPLMTFHELKFIEAEARQRDGQSLDNVKTALRAAITANFVYHGLTADAAGEYFDNVVDSRVTADALEEILIQKYIASYEFESIVAYNDYRRTGVPTLHNPHNVTVGFPNRLPYANSEESNNPDNFIAVDVLTQKVWWAGGSELVN
jgi:hypothetical protein